MRVPRLLRERVRVAPELAAEPLEERLLQREDEGGGLDRGEAQTNPGGGDLGDVLANVLPPVALDVGSTLQRLQEQLEEA